MLECFIGAIMDKKRNVFWIGVTSFFTDVSSEMILALLPLFLASLGVSRAMIGLIEGIAEFVASIFKVVSGWVSDRLQSRKGIVVAGYALSTAVKPLIALANTWYQVLSVRFVDRIGKGIRSAPRDALIADSVEFHERGKAFGFQRGMDTFGAVVGTLIASLLLFVLGTYTSLSLVAQYRTIFWLSLIPGIFAVLTFAFLVRDVRSKEFNNSKAVGSVGTLNPAFKAFLLISMIFELSNFSYAIYILRASSLGVIAALIPIIYLLYNIIYSLLAQPLGVLADKVGKKQVLFSGYFIASVMCLGFALADKSIYAWLLFAIYGVVSAITNTVPRALLADLVNPEMRGTAYGVYYMLIGFVALPASAIAGLLWDQLGPFVAFSYGSGLAMLAALLVIAIIPGKKSFAVQQLH